MRKCLILNFVALLQWILGTNSQVPYCCDSVSGQCALACKQLSLMNLISDPGSDSYPPQLISLSATCPLQLATFWNCMNETVNGLREGAAWEGRSCCSQAQTLLCQSACLTAQEDSDVERGCRRSDEPAVYHCLQKKHELELCCGQSNRPDCVATCQTLLREPSLAGDVLLNMRRRLSTTCERESSLISCVLNITQPVTSHLSDPQKFLPCCPEGRTPGCRETCKNVFQLNRVLEKVVIDGLVSGGCGHPRPDDRMWGCFLTKVQPQGATAPPLTIQRLGIDATKLHCCHRSKDEACRRLCHNTFSREWSNSWTSFDSTCLDKRNAPDQVLLRQCLEELDEPCELGCDGLNFCTEFNNRPAELFRRCSASGDISAQAQFQNWMSSGVIQLFGSQRLPIRNDSDCAVKWKSVACTLELKPCHLRSHATQICLADCVSLLHDCLDFDQVLDESQDVEEICRLVSAQAGSACISLSKYLPRNDGGHAKSLVSRPCRSQPCSRSQLCQVNSSGCFEKEDCSPYNCIDGCRLGEVSKAIVEVGALVRLPIPTPGCHRVCRCSLQGQISDCSSPKCDSVAPCWLHRMRIDHGTTFAIDCNICSCRSGEIACTKQNCANTIKSNRKESTLTCLCSNKLSPVCGSNGKTYFSHCVTRCIGLNDAEIEPGACVDKNPCDGVYCGREHRCIPYPRVCLHPYRRKCHQYQCVPLACQNPGTVCDTNGTQYESLCALAAAGRKFGHNGPCHRQGCKNSGQICGIDGNTYSSECVAEGTGIPADYDGHCRFLAVTGNGAHCPQAICPPLPLYCNGIVPPGACCPTCGGLVRLTFSPSLTLELAEVTDSPVTTIEIIRQKLETLVQTAECRLGVYLGQGAELVVIIRPRWNSYTKVQLFACAAEAHRISVLVNRKSPMLQVDAVLNLLSGAVSYDLGNAGKSIRINFVFIWILTTFVIVAGG